MAERKVENLPVLANEVWITKAHKAAVILASLSAETAKAIVNDISDAHLRAFAKAFSELKSVPPQLLEAIANEFVEEVQDSGASFAGGIEEARRVLGALTEEERINRVLSELAGGGTGSVWTRINDIDDKMLADYVQTQRLSVAAAIVTKLTFQKTADVLAHAEPAFSQKVLLELARRSPPGNAVINAIADAINEELLAPLAARPSTSNAGATVGEIINCLPAAKRDAFMGHLCDVDPEIGEAVKKAILLFEDLHLRLPESGVPVIMRELDRDVLLAALKYGETNAAETVEFLFANISKRMASQYREDIEELDELTESEGEKAQRAFTSAVRGQVSAGEIKLNAVVEETDAAEAE